MQSKQQLLTQLAQLEDKNTGKPYGSSVWSIEELNNQFQITLTLPYAALGDHAHIEQAIHANLASSTSFTLNLVTQIAARPTNGKLSGLKGVKNIIAVASGKGGVGKSTTTMNLALAMAKEGAKVGILDADIYGPSQGMMMGFAADTRPKVRDDKFFIPPIAHGVQVMSMAFLTTADTPVVWRGPMVTGALMQILTQTDWDDLDYLFVDMPPGTGDIQLTLAQKVPVTGAVIVTTPQDIALLDARRGIEMFRKVNIPVLGLVENMSVHICSNCGHQEAIFGDEGGNNLAQDYQVDFLGKLPLSMNIRQECDAGQSGLITDSESQTSLLYRSIARKLSSGLVNSQDSFTMPSIGMSDD
ncbi:iron-sulfur cluster carrier protein ApbC [Marinomonas agarivorans]|nr:iron-sulfur cluster carrier protein ApbC [Marinomonas agarivorans]